MTKRDAMEFLGGAVLLAMLCAVMWLFAALAPNQLSAEADANRAACDSAGIEYMPYKGGEG